MIKTIIHDNTSIKLRIIRYIIENKNYYLCTNILSLTHLNSTSFRKVLQDIYIHQLIFVIVGYFK